MNANELKEWINSNMDSIKHKTFEGCDRINKVEMAPLTDQTIVVVSEIHKATLILEMRDGSTKRIKVIAKFEPSSEGNFGEIAKEYQLCTTETMVYQEVLNKMSELIDSSEDNIFADCYLSKDNNFILEDLTESGFRIIPTQEMLDVNHAKMALEAIGKYHGMSLVLNEQNKLDMSKIPVNFFTKNDDLINKMFTSSSNTLADIIQLEWGSKWKDAPDRLRKAVTNVGEKIQKLYNSSKGNCDVLCHGDFTMRNMLFHHLEDDKTPDRVKLVDFQAANWSNLCFDLIPLLSSSLLPQIREANQEELLMSYSKSLKKTCSKLNYGGYVPTIDDIRKYYDKLRYFSMLYTIFSMPLFLAEKGDFDPDKMFDTVEDESKLGGRGSFQLDNFRHKKVHEALQNEMEICLRLNII